MLTHIHGAKCIGIDAVEVTVEVGIDRGIGIHLVGLADVAVKESLLRTATALESRKYRIPGKKIVINLAPADLHKNGSGYDLPIAVGIIAASAQRELPDIGRYIVMGELGLDGSVRQISGALSFTELAGKAGYAGIILPAESALEAVEMRGIDIFGIHNLDEAISILEGKTDCSDLLVWNSEAYARFRKGRIAVGNSTIAAGDDRHEHADFSGIIGQEGAKRGIEIAAAGGHNMLMIGAPGSGKSSLAKALTELLPPMTREESLVTSKIYSVVGKGVPQYGLIRRRPFRAPHYSASLAAIIGGGAGGNIIPGEVSLANGGVLFLDELAQMPRSVIEALRGPIEDRTVTISRLKSKTSFPASFMLIAASNPCPCGYYGEGDRCNCTPSQRMNYLSKLSGPILDRIDIQVWMHSVPAEKIAGGRECETSATVAARIMVARQKQEQRFASEGIHTNAEMSNRQIETYCTLDSSCKETIAMIMDRMQMSLRAYFRIIKVAQTIADLEGNGQILPRHLVEAASFRVLDKRW